MPSLMITVDLAEDDRETRAEVALEVAGRRFEATGRARRAPGDPSVPEVGEELALSRAFAKLAHDLLDVATERVDSFGG